MLYYTSCYVASTSYVFSFILSTIGSRWHWHFLQIKLRFWEITEFAGGHRDVWGYVTPKCVISLLCCLWRLAVYLVFIWLKSSEGRKKNRFLYLPWAICLGDLRWAPANEPFEYHVSLILSKVCSFSTFEHLWN